MVAYNDNPNCQRAKAYYYIYLVDDSNERIPNDIVNHIDHCSYCQEQLRALSEKIDPIDESYGKNSEDFALLVNLELQFNFINQPVSCNTVKPFLPVLASKSVNITIKTPITSHIDSCEKCSQDLENICKLGLTDEQLFTLGQIYAQINENGADKKYNSLEYIEKIGDIDSETLSILRNIALRPESDVVSTFKANESILDTDNPDKYSTHITERARQYIQSKSKTLIKPLAAAAAILVFVFTFFNNSKVDAVDISQMYNALGKVKHVHIVYYSAETRTIINEKWISPATNTKIIKTPDTIVLWDIKNRQKKSKQTGIDNIEISNLNKNQLNQIKATMQTPWSLLPFTNFKDLPDDAVWQQVEDQNLISKYQDAEIYDLTWSRKAITGSNTWYKTRCIINTQSHLPERMEYFDKLSINDDYKLANFKEIDYIALDEFNQIIKDSGI